MSDQIIKNIKKAKNYIVFFLLGLGFSLSVYFVQAQWNKVMSAGEKLTSAAWNNLVSEVDKREPKISFAGYTSAKHDGNFNAAGAFNGTLTGINNFCSAQFSGSRVCTAGEISILQVRNQLPFLDQDGDNGAAYEYAWVLDNKNNCYYYSSGRSSPYGNGVICLAYSEGGKQCYVDVVTCNNVLPVACCYN